MEVSVSAVVLTLVMYAVNRIENAANTAEDSIVGESDDPMSILDQAIGPGPGHLPFSKNRKVT